MSTLKTAAPLVYPSLAQVKVSVGSVKVQGTMLDPHPIASPVAQLVQSPAQLSIDLRASLQYAARRHVVLLFKETLAMFEQLAEEHDEAMEKLYAKLPPEYRDYVELADHYTEEKGDRIRRAVLQRGNDCVRAMEEEISKYDITFRQPPQV